MTKTEALAIAAPDFQHLQISIRGTAPLVVNRFSQKAMQIMKETQEAGGAAKSKRTRDPKDFEALREYRSRIAAAATQLEKLEELAPSAEKPKHQKNRKVLEQLAAA